MELKCGSKYSKLSASRSTSLDQPNANACPLPRRFFSSSSIEPEFSPPWRLKLMPGFSVQVSRVRTSRSTVVPSYAIGRITASYR